MKLLINQPLSTHAVRCLLQGQRTAPCLFDAPFDDLSATTRFVVADYSFMLKIYLTERIYELHGLLNRYVSDYIDYLYETCGTDAIRLRGIDNYIQQGVDFSASVMSDMNPTTIFQARKQFPRLGIDMDSTAYHLLEEVCTPLVTPDYHYQMVYRNKESAC